MSSMVLALDASGHPNRWINFEAAITAICKDQVSWHLGSEKVYYGGNSRLTGEVSSVSVPSIMAIKGAYHTKRRIPPLTNRNLFGRDRNTCGYCEDVTPYDKLTRDHIVPVSKGGLNVWSNCISSCKSCNCSKDDKLLSQWGKDILFVPYVPDRTEALILANRKILFDQMDFLKSHLPKHSRLL